jgi:hypothetical protein
VAVDERATTFWIAVDNFNSFLLCKDFSADVFRIERLSLSKILFKTCCKPNWNYIAEEHENTPEAHKEHNNEIYGPKELIEREK